MAAANPSRISIFRGGFDNIGHSWLLENVPMDRTVLRKWLHAGFVDKGMLFPTEAGTPQGGIASPVLANLALDGLEPQPDADATPVH